MKKIAATLALAGLLAGVLPSSANAALTFGVRPAFPREENSRTESIFVHTAGPGEVIAEGVRVINNSADAKHLLLYAEDSASSTGGGFACGQLSEESTGVGTWVAFDLSTFILVPTIVGEDSVAVPAPVVAEPVVVAEGEEVAAPVVNYVEGIKPGELPGTVDIVIPPGKDLIVPFTITVPQNAQVGESNGCILVQEVKSQEAEAGVSLSMRSGLRIAMTVPGDIKRELVFANFLKRREGGSMYFMPSVKNVGNVSVDTNILVDVRYFFGKRHEEFGGQFPILRGETYEFNFEMKRPFWGGLYSARSEFSYDNNPEAQVGVNTGKELTTVYSKKLWFFMMPTPEAAAIELGVLLILVVAGALGARAVQTRRMRKRWIPYTVRKNESLADFADRMNLNKKLVARVNGIRSPYFIYKGQVVVIPVVVPAETKVTKPRAKKAVKKTAATKKVVKKTLKAAKTTVKKRIAKPKAKTTKTKPKRQA
jgi:hypothetical protein